MNTERKCNGCGALHVVPVERCEVCKRPATGKGTYGTMREPRSPQPVYDLQEL